MLLIVFVGLVAKLSLVSDACSVGTAGVKDFDFARATGTWFVRAHVSNDAEDSLSCVTATYGPLEDSTSQITVKSKGVSTGASYTLQGTVTDLNGNSFNENFAQSPTWSGKYYVIEVDYDNYIILEMCSFATDELFIYVAYRKQQPDEYTLKKVQKELQKKSIESQVVDWPANNCQEAE